MPRFLDASLGEHGEAGLAHGHDVLVVAEDAQGVSGNGSGRDVEHARQQLAGYLIHVGNHEQQALRSGICAGQGASLERAVHGSGGAGLALHLLHQHALAKDVETAGRRPVVDVLRHRRRRGDGINGRYLGEHVADVGGGLIAVARYELLCFIHIAWSKCGFL